MTPEEKRQERLLVASLAMHALIVSGKGKEPEMMCMDAIFYADAMIYGLSEEWFPDKLRDRMEKRIAEVDKK